MTCPRGERLLTTIDSELAPEEGKVTTVSTGSVTFSGNSGQLPLTISNGLDQAVEVGVLLQADPSVRLSFTPPGLVIVDAGKRASIEVSVEVYGTGPAAGHGDPDRSGRQSLHHHRRIW